MASIRSIARHAGVSVTTVCRVLNNQPKVSQMLRQRVLSATQAAKYLPGEQKGTSGIAMVYAGEVCLGEQFDAAVMCGMSQGMQEHGFDLMVLDLRRARMDGESYMHLFRRKGIRGVIIRTTQATRQTCRQIAGEGFPAVVVADRFEGSSVSYVHTDSREASREAVEHLIELGHRQITVCINVVDDADHADRVAGFREAMLKHGLIPDARMVTRVPAHRDAGAMALRRLMSGVERPTALFLTDPAVAIGVFGAAREMGIRIPEDLSIIGMDDTQTRHAVYPAMTSVCQDATAMGREAFAALRGMLESVGPAEPVQKQLRAWFEVHQSTGPVRRDG